MLGQLKTNKRNRENEQPKIISRLFFECSASFICSCQLFTRWSTKCCVGRCARCVGDVHVACLVVCVSCVWVSGGAHFVVRRCRFWSSGRPFWGSGWSIFDRFFRHFFDIFGQKSGHFSPFLGPWDPFGGGYPKTPKNGFLERFRRLDGFSVAFLAKIWCPPPPSGGPHIWGSGPPKMSIFDPFLIDFFTVLVAFFDRFLVVLDPQNVDFFAIFEQKMTTFSTKIPYYLVQGTKMVVRTTIFRLFSLFWSHSFVSLSKK